MTSASASEAAKRGGSYFPLGGESLPDGQATATCYCGDVQLAFVNSDSRQLLVQPVEGEGFVDSFLCNCTDCRKVTASCFASNFIIADTHLMHTRGHEKLAKFTMNKTIDTGNAMTNVWCQTCGTLMYRVSSGFPGKSILRLGTVDDFNLVETKLKPRVEQFVKDRVGWSSGGAQGGVQQEQGIHRPLKSPPTPTTLIAAFSTCSSSSPHHPARRRRLRIFDSDMWLILALVLSALPSAYTSAASAASEMPRGDHSQSSIVAAAGDKFVIPGWQLQSSRNATDTPEHISRPGFDTSTWLNVSPRTTVFAGFLENRVYHDTDLFFSDNLNKTVDYSRYNVPFYYRYEFHVETQSSQRYFLQTHGITSRAQIHLNGGMLADEYTQVGAYGGSKYDITEHLLKDNCLLITAFPTNYLRDFALGFIDWNPYPPDNGTGVWRDIEIYQTGKVSLSTLRVATDFAPDNPTTVDPASVNIEIVTDVTNHCDNVVSTVLTAEVRDFPYRDDSLVTTKSTTVTLQPGEQKSVRVPLTLEKPKIWWPSGWGSQHLYIASLSATISNQTTDIAPPVRFGIRNVVSRVNAHNDTSFTVNGHPFFVLGAGYTPDLFSRFSQSELYVQFQRVLDMGLNTIRLEGKQSHPDLYSLADYIGLMVLPGWECCDKWEGWTYNDEANGEKWVDADYTTANVSMRHEAAMMQTHPSVLGFLVGSDYWPDDRATSIYVDALKAFDWQNPIIASAAKRGYPELLGPSGMKMEGPYDWVPPNYWASDKSGAAFGFGSELGAGVGTPDIASLRKFLSEEDLRDLWTAPEKGLYHMSTNVSQFYTRKIYNNALYARYGAPSSLEDYLLKVGIMDYEATRAQFEAYSMRKSADHPATGLIYWMLNNAWPSLHWQLFDYYLKPTAAYYGVKNALRMENAAFDYGDGSVWVYSHLPFTSGTRSVAVDVIDLKGNELAHHEKKFDLLANRAQQVIEHLNIPTDAGVVALRIIMKNEDDRVLSRSVYTLPPSPDALDWDASTWYHTPVSKYADLTCLFHMGQSKIALKSLGSSYNNISGEATWEVNNTAKVPAFFIKFNIVDGSGKDVSSAVWEDNFVTLWPGESINVNVRWRGADRVSVMVEGLNIDRVELEI
ncbi:hypothetical protein EJ05DRAFT_534352 [Pseudovirgaria hyperparasitica]|uniref:CENP-V/GFA domain-containing protein n=1 Tax=Pseudovirgaria hyperparasitica TaxID=470096 RepID=A0A6A6WL05_9PEZI|nr:uncharacterized protein EJ05DRAFT_534352 [Pseudovirgaria hyperparasitica]KAF2762884.1 hypothetical protein EJ05DRAFT_534352 [Pseudovirgaria hyperparasitica]